MRIFACTAIILLIFTGTGVVRNTEFMEKTDRHYIAANAPRNFHQGFLIIDKINKAGLFLIMKKSNEPFEVQLPETACL